jgi:hypothetical protein
MKCWYSAFNAQGSRLIIVVVQLGAVKIYVAAMEALRKKERQDETQFTTKIDGFLSFIPIWTLLYFFCRFFLNLTLCMTKLRVPQKLMDSSVSPRMHANVLLCRFFLNLTLCMTKLRVLVLCFSYFTDNCIVSVGYDRASRNGSLHKDNRKLWELKNYQFQLFLKP